MGRFRIIPDSWKNEERINMKRLYCKFEKVGEVAIGAALVLMAIPFCIFGFVTLAPVVVLFLAVPVIALSIYLFGIPPVRRVRFKPGDLLRNAVELVVVILTALSARDAKVAERLIFFLGR